MTARRSLAALALVLLPSSLLAAAAKPPAPAPKAAAAAPTVPRAGLPPGPPYALEPASTGGVAEVDRDLERLLVHERLLVIGAHPDDEDTALLALVARGMGGEAAYLALSRGEGGQNVVGPELGADLGLIRTQELLAARRVDGGRQFFTRAFDFGYTTSLQETLEKWPKAELLEDVVRVIRRFRPQVIVSVFPNDGRGGHGQHQAAGVVAYEAFKAAGDARAFPELARQGLPPWKAQALYRETWFDREATTMTLPLGVIDPISGHSIFQLAAASRSRHRSQSMGRVEEIGPREARLAWVAGAGGKEATQVFAGIDTRPQAIATLLPEGEARTEVGTELDLAAKSAAAARARLAPADLAAAVPEIAAAAQHLELARVAAARLGAAGEAAVEILAEKIACADRALAAAANLVVDATAPRAAIVPGEPVKIKLALWNAGTTPVRLEGASAQSLDGWRVDVPAVVPRDLAAGELFETTLDADPTAAATPTQPYFLRQPRRGDRYDWSTADPLLRGEPFGPPPVVVVADLTIAGTRVQLAREAVFRGSEEAVGEVRQPLRAVPAIEVSVAPHLLVWPLAQTAPRTLAIELQSNSAKAVQGELRVQPPAGWPAVAPRPFSLAAGERASFAVPLAPPPAATAQRAAVRVEAVVAGDGTYGEAVPTISLPHIPPTPRVVPATVDLVAADIRLPALGRLGYVRGASDEVPEALQQIGLPIEVLTEAALESGDLSRYDAIVVGSRAYETSAALRQANPRLLDYLRRGGLLIVQYQQYPFVDGKFAALPFDIARPHDRVTDENAPITVLLPQSPVLTTPNRIGPEDWQGWVQERGLYFAHSFDPGYTALLEMADKGQAPQRGGLLVAKVGEGTYVYTGLAFFRQLPAGVPGAYRLFANLLALRGEAPRR